MIGSMVPEIIRWQTPIAYMRRTAVQDTELGGKHTKDIPLLRINKEHEKRIIAVGAQSSRRAVAYARRRKAFTITNLAVLFRNGRDPNRGPVVRTWLQGATQIASW